MKITFFLFFFIFLNSLYARDLIKYNKPSGLQNAKIRITKIQNYPIRLSGNKNSIAQRKLEQFKKNELKKLFDKNKSLAILVCTEVFNGDIGLGINADNNSVSFCLFKDDSLLLIDSLNSWVSKIK